MKVDSSAAGEIARRSRGTQRIANGLLRRVRDFAQVLNDGIVDLVDGLVESFQGKYGIIGGYTSYDIEGYKSTEATIKYLQGLCGKVEGLRDCCEDSYIQNQIDTVCELINSTLYKLRFLK